MYTVPTYPAPLPPTEEEIRGSSTPLPPLAKTPPDAWDLRDWGCLVGGGALLLALLVCTVATAWLLLAPPTTVPSPPVTRDRAPANVARIPDCAAQGLRVYMELSDPVRYFCGE